MLESLIPGYWVARVGFARGITVVYVRPDGVVHRLGRRSVAYVATRPVHALFGAAMVRTRRLRIGIR
jgi:hypothetical protein